MTHGALVIHGHFYQPDRRDPRTGIYPVDPTARPDHDWNARIERECYGPNAEEGNFAWLSFDLGPTLSLWMADTAPRTLARIARSAGTNAMAQSFHHSILPLASSRDRRTEIRWGMREYALRFGRQARGLWLPETAVNLDVLASASEEGIAFTILAPWQADQQINPRQLYRANVGQGRTMIVAFYDGPLSASASFEGETTENADRFVYDRVRPILDGAGADGHEPLLLVATDGELYGHHKAGRDRFLAALPATAARADVAVTSLGSIVAGASAQRLPNVRIRERTSWSCHHGVARWEDACPDAPDGSWKRSLRRVLDDFAGTLDEGCERSFGRGFWDVRDGFVDTIVGAVSVDRFITREAARFPERLRDALEAQRSRLAMYTSCAWYWGDPWRQEVRQVLEYAAHAALKGASIAGADLPRSLERALATVRLPGGGTAADVAAGAFARAA